MIVESCVHECSFISADDGAILSNYLPLLREYLPETAVEIESGIRESKEGFIYFFILHSLVCSSILCLCFKSVDINWLVLTVAIRIYVRVFLI